MTDYHIHTSFNDGANTLDQMIEACIEKGMDEVGITDHFGIFPETGLGSFKIFIELDQYFDAIKEAKEKYKDRIKIKGTLELDTYEENLDEMTDLLNSYHPDYILGGIHELNGIGYTKLSSFWDITDYDYENYLETLIRIVRRNKIDLLAHYNDYKLFYRTSDESRFYDYYKELAKALRDTNTATEFNTSVVCAGFRIDPNLVFWKECGKLGVPVILCSDAHDKKDICSNFAFCKEILLKAGVKTTCTFTDRKMEIRELK